MNESMGVTKGSAGESKERREWHSQVTNKICCQRGVLLPTRASRDEREDTAAPEALSCVRCGRVSRTLERASGASVLERELV